MTNPETVHVAPADKRKSKVYHTRGCGKLPARPREMERDVAKSFGYTECGHCTGRTEAKPTFDHYRALVNAATDE